MAIDAHRAIAILAAIAFAIVGLSHLVRAHAWLHYFAALRARGDAGAIEVALLNLPLGLLIVAFHDVRAGAGLVLTVIGWALLLKATLYLVFPAIATRALERVRAWQLRFAGVLMLGFALWLSRYAQTLAAAGI